MLFRSNEEKPVNTEEQTFDELPPEEQKKIKKEITNKIDQNKEALIKLRKHLLRMDGKDLNDDKITKDVEEEIEKMKNIPSEIPVKTYKRLIELSIAVSKHAEEFFPVITAFFNIEQEAEEKIKNFFVEKDLLTQEQADNIKDEKELQNIVQKKIGRKNGRRTKKLFS